jgi:signal transduction histidine kinase
LRRLAAHVTSYDLAPKLFLSHLAVALVGTSTVVAVSLLAPLLFRGLAGWPFDRELVAYLLVAGLAAAVTAALASLFVARRISAPVRRMLVATRRVSAGHYDERVPVAEPDELGELSEGFNAMAEALQEGERRRREFIADVSHELRTPISTLQGYAEGLVDGIVEPSEETFGLMHAEAERMRRLVDDLRQLSRAETGELSLNATVADPARLLKRACEGMAPLFTEKGVGLRVRTTEGSTAVLADPDRVVQVLVNLLGNALRHTPPGGWVEAEAAPIGGEVRFAVADTGEGLETEHLSHLFERFYRVEKSRSRTGSRGGSGLGLAISRALVEAMGGAIRAESAGPGRGARFVFALPAAVDARVETEEGAGGRAAGQA